MDIRAFLLVTPVGFSLLLGACSPSPKRYSDAEIAFLASDAYIKVAEQTLVVPYVALSGLVSQKQTFSLDRGKDRQATKDRLEKFSEEASNRETAPQVDKLEITMRTYGWNDFDTSFIRICSLLRREWARSVCDDPWAPIKEALPHDNNLFYLFDLRNPGSFDNHWTVGLERVSDQLRKMDLEAGKVSVVCDPKPSTATTFCTAAVKVKENLAAKWTVWDGTQETFARQADREGAAIKTFVLNALGSEENYPALLSVACELKRPSTSTVKKAETCN